MSRIKAKMGISYRAIIVIACVLGLIIGATIVYVCRDDIADRLDFGNSSVTYSGDPFTFESGSMQVSAAIKNGLVLASTNGMQVLDSGGVTRVKQVYSMSSPALVSSDVKAAAFDVGGTSLCVAALDGSCDLIDTGDKIINVTMNQDGWMAVCTQTTGYKGKVTVYNPEMTAVYEWYSGEGYLLSASVSPDHTYMAALGVESSGGTVHFFSLDSEKEQGCFIGTAELFTDLCWMSDSRLGILSQNRFVIVDKSGVVKGNYDFEGLYLTEYNYDGDGFVVFALGKYRTGGDSTVVSVGADGKVIGEDKISDEIYSIAVNKKTVAVLGPNNITMYTSSMSRMGSGENVSGIKDIVVRNKGDVLLLSSYYAELRSF